MCAGNVRSLAMEAIAQGRQGHFDRADLKLEEAGRALGELHLRQKALLEESLEKPQVSMLMAHAHDHLMNAITVLDLAGEFCHLYRLLFTGAPG